VANVLIMVDQEGDMVAKDKKVRMQSAINHRKWVEIAAYLGCHAIRCNARGGGNTLADDPDSLERAAESFGELVDYAKPFKINVIIENHGGLSSDPAWLPALCKKINSPHFGLLPDYGNYPKDISQKGREEAVRKAMPYAKGVSVKAGWQPDGTHPAYRLEPLIEVSRKAGYAGFWGIESGWRGPAGKTPEEIKKHDWQAVLWTKRVIEKTVLPVGR
jgi:sugar phosphate isomerase/epimerase